jgi:ferredoxin-NADP reductase
MTATLTTLATTLTSRETVAEGTMAFHFRKPDGFRFKPGQAIDLVLGDLRHAYSIVSAPFEDELVIATRMRDSEFKRALKAAVPGSHAGIDGPFGSLTLHKDAARPAVLIAGGIGITPFVSILRQAAADRLAHRIVLLYSVRRPADAAFLEELRELEARNPNFRVVATVTQPHAIGRGWKGESGHIDARLLERIQGEIGPRPVYYLAGPPAMVAGLRQALEGVKVDDEDIHAEEFFGY